MLRFVRGLIALRHRHPSLRRRRFLRGRREPNRFALPDVTWSAPDGRSPEWDEPSVRALCWTLAPRADDEPALHVMVNMSPSTVSCVVPLVSGCQWSLAVDTASAPPEDVVEPGMQAPVGTASLDVHPHSLIVLEGREALRSG